MLLGEEEETDFRNDQESVRQFRDFFKRKKVPFTEAGMIECLQANRSKSEVYFAILALRDLGTEACVPALKAVVRHKVHDCQSTSVLTLVQVVGDRETAFLGDLLLDKAYRAKDYALWALLARSTHEAVPQVMEFLEGHLKKLPPHDDLVSECVAYLKRHRQGRPEVEAVFARVRDRFNRLSAKTRDYLKRVDGF